MPSFAVAFLSEAKMIEISTGKLCEGSSTFRTLWGKVPRVSLQTVELGIYMSTRRGTAAFLTPLAFD